MSNLVLTGFMGTGKSTIGRKLAKRLGMNFVDTDQEVERITGLTVHQLFKKHGEIRFRSEEKAAIRRIVRDDNLVIATGGGVVLFEENMNALRENGTIICLTATPETIFRRVKGKKSRPLLNTDNPLEKIKELLADRKDYYANADAVVDTSESDIEDVVNEIVRIYTEQRKGS